MSDASPIRLKPRTRLASVDWMRGFVMVLMAVDHASIFYNADRVALDSAAVYTAGDALPPTQFFLRWITHLCAPTFLFLAGTALALSAARRRAAGRLGWAFDRDLLIRGALIAGLEVGLLGSLAPVRLFSVLFAIGVSMMLMVPLRRLPGSALLVLTLGWFIGAEAVTSLVWQGHGDAPVWAALTLARHYSEEVRIIYPVLQWLPMMVLGWVFGNHLHQRKLASRPPPIRLLLGCGAASLLVFSVVRAIGGYGNMFLAPENGSLVQMLHVSKYPPSLTFVTLELGLMAICLAGFMWLEPRVKRRPNGLLLVLGQTALFFYILHFLLLGVVRALAVEPGGTGLALLAAMVVIAVLYPACRWFRAYKRAHPDAWVRFI